MRIKKPPVRFRKCIPKMRLSAIWQLRVVPCRNPPLPPGNSFATLIKKHACLALGLTLMAAKSGINATRCDGFNCHAFNTNPA
jgi:hypothetical protein